MTDKDKHSREREPARCMVIHPTLKRGGTDDARDPQARLDEAKGLAQAIDLDIVHGEVVPIPKLKPSTYLGQGQVDRLAQVVEDNGVEVAVMDCAVTPVQQRNLERAWKCKVIDRTGLILEIFGERARTREGMLQVELAHLSYQRSRLVRSWTHLERQRGGFGFLGGPGETQIEIDRRLIGERIAKLKKELEEVKRTRHLHREARRRVPYPIIALVGYTNAGKSTLFNRLTRAEVYAQDQLFATLDPTMRGLMLPSGTRAILSDTVGFVSDLPHELVAAFHATLEEVLEADVIVHVRDAASPDTDAQKADVEAVLRVELNLGEEVDEGLLEAMNKIDLLPEDARAEMVSQARRSEHMVALSAVTGEGTDDLLRRIDGLLQRNRQTVEMDVPLTDGGLIAWLYRKGDVISRSDGDEVAHMVVRLDPADADRLRNGNHRT